MGWSRRRRGEVRHRLPRGSGRRVPDCLFDQHALHRGPADQRRHLRRDLRDPFDHRAARRGRLLPVRADFTVDADCAPVCGNGVVERPAESCDRQMPASCPATCQPVGACTKVEQQGVEADCSATCVATPIVDCVADDGCCPPGCSAVNDPDCPAICGDGAVEARRALRQSDHRRAPRARASARATTATPARSTSRTARWRAAPGAARTAPITACLAGDGCCPDGCTAATDGDCNPECGDGKLGAGETCDPPATCPTTCPDDGDPCTRERLGGDAAHCDAACHHDPITACSGSTADACCPTGCTSATDSDC